MLILAPLVTFDGEKHEYFFKGKQISGITGLISKKLGLNYQNDFVGEHAAEGIHIHQAVQKWIETGESGSVHPGVQWVIEALKPSEPGAYFAEVLVTDLERYASAVDVVFMPEENYDTLKIYDIKKGKFNREYVTWQLSIYKYFIEKVTKFKVGECACLAVKDKEVYPIFPKGVEQVEKLLYNK